MSKKKSSSKSKSRRRKRKPSPELKAKAEALVADIRDPESLKKKRDEYNQRTKNLIQERRRLRDDARMNRDRANEYREKRDKYNDEVQELKTEKNKYYEKLDELNEKLKEVKKKEKEERKSSKRKSRKKRPSPHKIRRKIKHLEQRIITEEMDLKEENEIISEIQKLEQIKNDLEAHSGGSKESRKLIKEIKSTRKKINDIQDEMSKISQESQNCHVLMLDLYKENDMLRKEMQEIRNQLTESKVIADEFHYKYRANLKKSRRRQRSGGRVNRHFKKQVAEDTLQDAISKKKKGEKLNIFEARALFENAVSDQPDDNDK